MDPPFGVQILHFKYYTEHIIVYIPPLEKGGQGGCETWENLPKSPFAKGGFLDQGKNRRGEKTIKKSEQFQPPKEVMCETG